MITKKLFIVGIIPTMMILSMTTGNLNASEQEVELALEMENSHSLPNKDIERNIESNENSERSAHRGEISRSLTVEPGDDDDDPAHESIITIERDDGHTKTLDIQSAEPSSNSAVDGTSEVIISESGSADG